jgi:NAD+ kinase
MVGKKLILTENTKIALVYRLGTPAAVNLAKALSSWLKTRGYFVATAPEQKLITGTKLLKNSAEMGKMGLIVVLGGDGTYLRAVRLLRGQPVPILGINLGSLGFLTPTRADEAFTAIEQTLQNKMEFRPRSMLKVTLFRKRKKKAEGISLNDVVLERGSLSQLINLDMRVDGEFVQQIKGDGIIVASPTGSTAYNLAAGGPILHPDLRAIVVTPVSPHSLTSRPTIFPDNTELSLKLVRKLQDPIKKHAHLVIDGQLISDLWPDDEVRITRSPDEHYLIKDPSDTYFGLLREKLKFGNRE